MKRFVDMNEISDGKLYSLTDTVNCDSHDCMGCSKCCHDTAGTIILDPYDCFKLCRKFNTSLAMLMASGYVELNVIDSVTLPLIHIESREKGCPFLDKDGRCSIHDFRPGFCRLFPLGRIYEGDSFKYFLQTKECPVKDLSPVKVYKWIGEKNIKEYERFIMSWHNIVSNISAEINAHPDDIEKNKELTLKLLNTFYFDPYNGDYFYGQYEERVANFSL